MIWNYPTRVLFGAGETRSLGDELEALGGSRPLVVSDPGVRSAGLLEPALSSLEKRGLPAAVFDEVDPNPTQLNVERGAEAYRAHGADCLVGIGGGSPLDVAKLIAVRVSVDNPFEELDDAVGGDRHIPKVLPPIAAIPTTAGTGSEVGRSGVLTLESTGRKTVIFAPSMLPKVAILDPELSRSMPAQVTAATGFDALTHCLEALVAKGDHPMADAIALGGIELVQRSLLKAMATPDDLDARGDMLKAAMMGATAFQKGLGACHSLAHPLSSECGLHHGLANALCLPAVVEFNLPQCRAAYDRVAQVLGGQNADELADVLRRFRDALGLPSGLAQSGVAEQQLERLADLAIQDACHTLNPRVCTRDDLLRLYRHCL